MSVLEIIVHKATNSKVTAPKRKHVRSIVLECHNENSARSFLHELYKRPLDTNEVVCYKAIITIHKVVQEGPKNVLSDVSHKISWFENLRQHWRRHHDKAGFANLVGEYCTFMIDKIRFHQAHPEFDGGLTMDGYQKNHKFEDVEIDRGLQTVSHLMDMLDAVFRMQNAVVDAAPYNDCKTASFIPLVMESYAIYLLVVQFLTSLVDITDNMEVIDFAIQRFYVQYQTLRNFYINANAVNSVSSVIAVPNLPPDPPKFVRRRRETPKQRVMPQPSPPPVKAPPPPQPEITQIPVPVPTPVFIRQTVPVVYGNPFMQQQDNTTWGQYNNAGAGAPMYNPMPAPMPMPQPPPPIMHDPTPLPPPPSSQWVTFDEEANRQRSNSTPVPVEKTASLDKNTSPVPSTATSGGAEKTRVITKIITKTVSNTAELNALRARIEELERLLAEEQDKNRQLQMKLSEREAMIQEVTNARKRVAEISESNDKYTAEVVKQNDQLREQFTQLRDYYEKQRVERMEADFNKARKDIALCLSALDNPNNLGNQEATEQMLITDLIHHMGQATNLMNMCYMEGEIPEMSIFGAVGGVSDSLKNLFFDAKGVSRLINNQGDQSRFLDAARKIGALTQNLFDSVRHQGGQCQDEEDRKRIASNIKELQQGTASLEHIARHALSQATEERPYVDENGFDLDDLAERELMAAAKTIEDAAKSLLAAKSRRPPKKEGDMPDVAEAIIEAAMAITSATSTLVGAATTAQKERVEKGRAGHDGPLYRKDPTWAEGLISAAKSVAAATKQLVETANKAANGQDIAGGTEEALIASSKQVTAATSQLVSACKSKSDINSPSQHKLSNCAKSVQNATNLLVAAAKAVSMMVGDEEVDFGKMTVTGYKVKEMEQQMAILRLEKELEFARKGLSTLKKQQYNVTEQQV
ncbi:hypothetical protein SAMD00019534_042410 [Acytostelium subglobosum LB1]|uniref:hypothetical protein n=1 Tax=Acytostelium subglobosum LB1 TaxID=1410327 RepID=UPI000644B01B|nr:hypothetical protein SAMD00019534_042410 [Acytostelium subglobosum LB1]GAM21066.1 hypothetical protein SAMD00019534_042410 [Acytostelium subglobosum LB1]|eukprot:XP_012756200.1 hypothetical protein SAMD00019534_042410 [Acytostelium subglobosum LB1]